MNRFAVGFAWVAGLALAAPMAAWSADGPPAREGVAPPQRMVQMGPGMRGDGMRGDGMGAMSGVQGDGMGMMGRHHGGPGSHAMHRMRQLPPQQRCEERLAHRAAVMAYTVTKLKLTAEQRPLWDKVDAGMQAARERQLQLCALLSPREQGGQATVLDRLGRQEQFLTARLQGVQQVRPALEQLYQALRPEQKAIIDQPLPHRRGP